MNTEHIEVGGLSVGMYQPRVTYAMSACHLSTKRWLPEIGSAEYARAMGRMYHIKDFNCTGARSQSSKRRDLVVREQRWLNIKADMRCPFCKDERERNITGR